MNIAWGKRIRGVAAAAAMLVLGALSLPRAYGAIDKTYEQLKVLIDILDYIRENYVDEVKDKDLVYGAARGMVATLDPFSQFMDPDLHRDVKTDTEGQFGGLGIRLGARDEWLTIIPPLPGTPAFRAGILPEDRIIKIEGESTKDLSLADAVKKLRGKPGSKVAITVARKAEKEGKDAWSTHEMSLVREIIVVQSVDSRMLENKTGYLKINEFTAHTAEDVVNALAKLKKDSASAVVLDLRNNPGGLLTAAVDVASFFIGDNKMIVYTQGRRPENKQEFRAGMKAPFGYVPMVVLINRGSASGSEIVAGALQDHKRAVVIGDRSFGKASVQSVIPLSDGSGLRLTVAHYFTPSGNMIQRDEKKGTGGIVPDIMISITPENEMKLMAQAEQIYKQGEDPKSAIDEKSRVKDEVLERALELLRAREVLGNLNTQEG